MFIASPGKLVYTRICQRLQKEVTVDNDTRYCATQLCEERRLARTAPCPEAAELHIQLASLYKAEFETRRATAKRRRAGSGGRRTGQPHRLQ